jgi:curved DNA-binding protein CbpA
MKDYYAILEVSPEASPEVITNAYRALVKKYHPDRYYASAMRSGIEERMQEINEAYTVLSTPDTRQQYDRRLETYRQQAPTQTQRAKRTRELKKLVYWFLLVLFLALFFRTLVRVAAIILMSPVGKVATLALVAYITWKWLSRKKG